MSASKDKERGTWKIYLRYVDWQGVKQIHTKRGFATKRETLEYEREFLASKSRDLNMLFESFVEIYLSDLKPRIKYNTYLTKVHIIETKIIPYFAKKSIAEITASDILQWQNELLKKSDGEGKQYSQTYLRTIQNAILNHANKYYGFTELRHLKNNMDDYPGREQRIEKKPRESILKQIKEIGEEDRERKLPKNRGIER